MASVSVPLSPETVAATTSALPPESAAIQSAAIGEFCRSAEGRKRTVSVSVPMSDMLTIGTFLLAA